jgi:hypothetical protein
MAEPFALIYAAVPRIACQGKCQGACGPIAASRREMRHFEKQTGERFPDAVAILKSGDLSCPLLNPIGQCSVYRDRPLICRLWGVVEAMPCRFGCVPERMLSETESRALLKLAE